MADHVLIRRLILVPQLALGDVAHRELPVLRRFLQTVEKALALLLLREVEEELQHHRAVASEILLERRNILESFAPDGLRHQFRRNLLLRQNFRMHAYDQHFLIVGAVEDADASAFGKPSRRAPHEVVIEFLR